MNVHPVVPNPQKWINYYRSTVGKTSRAIQRGSGGNLGPSRYGNGRLNVVPNVVPLVVAPTEQAVKQAKAEIKHRRGYKDLGDNTHVNRRAVTTKRTRSHSSSEPKKAKKKRLAKKHHI